MNTKCVSIKSQIACLIFLTLGVPLLHAGNDTWNGGGGDNNWNTAGNWTAGSVNRPPLTGDALFFDGFTQLTANNSDSAFTFAGLTFNSTAGAFTLTGNSFTASAGLVDNSLNLETINLPIAFSTSHSINIAGGGSLTINNVIYGTSYTLTKNGGGLLTLTGDAAGANTYGPTTINAGSLLLDFSQVGSTPTANIVPSAALTLSGGALIVNGSATGANSQSFTSTTCPAPATTVPGQNIISATNGASGGTATINLAALSMGAGSSLVFNGPATIGAGNVGVNATATITTTTAGQGPTTASVYGVLAAGGNNNTYATVGLYDWASTDTTGDTAGTSPYTIIGGSQVSGFYSLPGNNAGQLVGNADFTVQQTPTLGGTGNVRDGTTGTGSADSIRYNTPNAPYMTVKANNYEEVGGILITPNMGYINAGLDQLRLAGTSTQIVQNNVEGVFCFGINGDSPFFSNSNNGGEGCVKSGQGTLFLNPGTPMHIAFNYLSATPTTNTSTSTYYDSAQANSSSWASFYFNGGVTVINNSGALGNPTGTQSTTAGGGGTVNLNGGTLMAGSTTANAGSVILTNGASTGSVPRPVFIGGNGGGLAAQSGTTFAVGGVVAGASGTGPLTIGIAASSANNNTVGLVPGTGAGTANPAFNATGTVILTNGNTYFGGTVLQSGTLNINGINALGGADYGGVTFNGGTLQYATAFSGNGSGDLTSVGTAGVTVAAGGGTIDVNGNAVTYAGPIGNGGSGALTVKSTAANGILTLDGANTYTGNTTISGGTLKLASSGSLLSKNVNVGSGSIFDVSALAYTVGAGQALLGGGVVTGNVATASSAMIIPGNLGTAGTLSFSNNLSLASGETNYFDLSASPAGSNDKIIVAGTLTLPASGKSTIGINFTAAPGVGRYPLITYTALAGGSVAANLTTNAFTGSSIGSLVAALDNSIPGEIDLVLSNPHTPSPITWLGDGVANNWDTTTLNWTNFTSDALTAYFDFDYVTFDDNGSTNPAVNLTKSLSPSSVTVSSTNNYTFSGPGLIGFGSLTKSNTDTLTILTTNTLPGPIVIQGGTLQLGNGIASGTIGTGAVTNNAALVMDSPATVATGPITGTGNTTIIVGTLAIGGNSTLGSLALGSSDGSDTAGMLDLANSSATVTGLTLGLDGTGGTIGSSGAATPSTLHYVGGNSTAYAGVIQDTLGAGSETLALNVNSSGVLTLSGVNTYSGGTIISNGTVSIGAANNLGTGTISLLGGTVTCTAGATANVVFANTVNVPAGTVGTFNMSPRLQLAPITGGGTFNLNVSGATVSYDRLAGAGWGSFTGILNITGTGGATVNKLQGYFNGGAFDGNLANAVVNLDDVSLEGWNNSFGNTFYLGALSGTATAVLGGGDFAGFQLYQIGALNQNTTFAGTIIDGTVQSYVRKVGTGSLTLSGANTYTGPTTVSNGTLIVSGSLGSTLVTNYSGATLAGTGTFGGVVDLEPGSVVTPVVGGYGTMVLSSDLTFDGGTNLVSISTTNVSVITVGGNVNIAAGTIQLHQTGTFTNGTYTLITYSGSLNGSLASLALNGFTTSSGQVARLDSSTFGQINLIVQNLSTASLVWASAGAQNNIWDVGSSINWSNGASLSVFNIGDKVTFDDSGEPNSPVQIAAVELPCSMVVTGTLPYDFADAGGTLAGATNSLTVSGTGSLEIDTVNSYGGPTTIGSGYTLTVGNGFDSASLGTGAITNNGALIFNQTNNLLLPVVSGTGSLTAEGASTVTLTGTYGYTGSTTIGTGTTLQAGTGGATGLLQGSLTDNGTLIVDVSGNLTNNSAITGSGNLILNGSALITQSVTNTYQGNTYVETGELKMGTSNAVPNGVTVPGSVGWFILDGNATNAGTIDLNGFNEQVNALQGLSGTALGDITNSTGANVTNTLTFGNYFGGATTTYAGLITENTNTPGGKIALLEIGISTNVLTGANSFSGGTIVAGGTLTLGNNLAAGSGPISLSNGVSLDLIPNPSGDTSIFPGNDIFTGAGDEVTNSSSSLGNEAGGLFISGDANSTNVFAASYSLASSAVKQFESFTGTVQVAPGGTLRFASSQLGTNGGDNTTFDVEGTLCTRNGNGGAGNAGPGVSLGALTGAGFLTGAISASGSSIYVIGAKGLSTTFSGVIQDGGNGNTSIVKIGAGTLILNGTVTNTGSTTVNNGVLALVDPVVLDYSPTLNLGSSTATIDVSGLGIDTLNLGNLTAQTLNGIGNINGNLDNQANSIVAVGLGALHVSGTATLTGATILQLNRTNAPNCSEMIAGAYSISGPLTVTNVGPALQGGDTFQLFSTGVPGFTATNLPVLAAGMIWSNTIASNGRLSVLTTFLIPSVPPAITYFSVSGGNIVISGTNGQAGGTYYLLATTNLVTPRTQWRTVATNIIGAANYTFIGTNAFVTNAPQRFYMLSSTNSNP